MQRPLEDKLVYLKKYNMVRFHWLHYTTTSALEGGKQNGAGEWFRICKSVSNISREIWVSREDLSRVNLIPYFIVRFLEPFFALARGSSHRILIAYIGCFRLQQLHSYYSDAFLTLCAFIIYDYFISTRSDLRENEPQSTSGTKGTCASEDHEKGGFLGPRTSHVNRGC